jgi:hypothetical protein
MNWVYLITLGTIIFLQQHTLTKLKRIETIMATDFATVLAEAKAQGEQLDKVLLEVQAGNASAVTPEQLDELKSVLDSNKAKLQQVDDAHPDTGNGGNQTSEPEQPAEPTPDAGDQGEQPTP